MRQAREHVTADIVGAEREPPSAALGPNGRREKGVTVLLAGVVRRDDIGEGREQDDHHDGEEPDDRPAVAPEIPPELGQRVRRLGGVFVVEGVALAQHGSSGRSGCEG